MFFGNAEAFGRAADGERFAFRDFDAVGETVNYVAQGIMREEDALERLRFQKINNQIAFCTEKALKYIAYVRRIEVDAK